MSLLAKATHKSGVTSVLVTSLFLGLSVAASAQSVTKKNERSQLVPRQLLGLVHAPEVHSELKMTAEQVTKLEALFEKIDGYWFRARNLPADKQLSQILTLENEFQKWAKVNLSSAQRERLRQLEYRAQGVRMLLRDDLAKTLGLSDEQIAQLTKAAQETNRVTEELRKATMSNKATDAQQQAVVNANQKEQEDLKQLMSVDQFQKLSAAIGEPFDPAQLRRIYPMAPELIPVSNWINSEPLTLEQLRGKVVVLHFYAFQCHNCHANFGHYQKWHEQYGDDVVVLGIQTPETSRERDPSAVRDAAKERELDFPIMVDLESKNWSSWANTMWPTVYVIDKNGYIRQWWQGELNWNGATGDQTIQSLIDELLREETA